MYRIDEVSYFLVPIKQIKMEILREEEDKMFWDEGMEVEALDS